MGAGLRNPRASVRLDGAVCQKISRGTGLIRHSFSKTIYNSAHQTIKVLVIVSKPAWLSGLEKGRSCNLVIRRTDQQPINFWGPKPELMSKMGHVVDRARVRLSASRFGQQIISVLGVWGHQRIMSHNIQPYLLVSSLKTFCLGCTQASEGRLRGLNDTLPFLSVVFLRLRVWVKDRAHGFPHRSGWWTQEPLQTVRATL